MIIPDHNDGTVIQQVQHVSNNDTWTHVGIVYTYIF